jgi:general secretion pathway protein I
VIRRARGFSLLEVIAAIAVLAIAFAALMQVAGSSLSLTARAAERTEAALRARSLLDGAFVIDQMRTGDSDGRFDDRYAWHMTVTQVQMPGQSPDDANASGARMYRLDLDVIWGERSARFSTLRLASIRNTANSGALP